MECKEWRMKLKWFKHDTDASSDAKIKKLILKHGAEGYAVYFHCIELIVNEISETNITFELEHDAEIIADNLKIKSDQDISAIDKVNNIMTTIVNLGLFEESNSRITCLKLAKRLDQSMTSNVKMRSLIGNMKKNHDSVMISHDNVMGDKKRLDKIRIDKNNIDEKLPSSFPNKQLEENTNTNDIDNTKEQEEKEEDGSVGALDYDRIKNAYPTKTEGKHRIRSTQRSVYDKKKLKKLIEKHGVEYIVKVINAYVDSQDGKFLKNFKTFINQFPSLEDFNYKNDEDNNTNSVNPDVIIDTTGGFLGGIQ